MTNLTIHCPKCKHTHEVSCESVWDERGLLRAFAEVLAKEVLVNTATNKMFYLQKADAFLKEREG